MYLIFICISVIVLQSIIHFILILILKNFLRKQLERFTMDTLKYPFKLLKGCSLYRKDIFTAYPIL
jgi:hypothetical protein